MKLLVKAGTTVWAQEMIYNAVVHIVLLYRSNIWVVRYVILKVLE